MPVVGHVVKVLVVYRCKIEGIEIPHRTSL